MFYIISCIKVKQDVLGKNTVKLLLKKNSQWSYINWVIQKF